MSGKSEHMKYEPLSHFPFKKLVFCYYLSFTWNGLGLIFILTHSVVKMLCQNKTKIILYVVLHVKMLQVCNLPKQRVELNLNKN